MKDPKRMLAVAATVPPEHRLVSAETIGAMCDNYSAQYALTDITSQPGFPAPVEVTPDGKPRWVLSEVSEWLKQRRKIQPSRSAISSAVAR